MIKKEIIFEYYKTVLWSLLAVFIAVLIMLAVIQHNVYETENKKSINSETIEYYMVGVLIEKNKYLEKQSPKNYVINLKLGILYEIYRDYKNAEIQYQLAIAKAPYEEYKPQYKLANLYIRLGRIADAQNVMDAISEKPDKTLLNYKAEIYTKIGDAYYNKADYAGAIVRYEKALTYYRALKSDKTKDLENSVASAYVYLADDYISNMQIDEAIDALYIANSIVNAPIIKYKLGLLISATDPKQAYEYFNEVFAKEPSLINYDEYYNFSQKLASDALAKGEIAQSELYKYKAKKIKEYCYQNILSVNDLSVESIEGEIVRNSLLKKEKIVLDFKLRNSSLKEIKSLYLKIVFKEGNKVLDEFNQQAIIPEEPLKSGMMSPIISIRATKKRDNTSTKPENIIAEISASKTQDTYQIILAKVEIKETAKGRSIKYRIKLWLKDTKTALKKLFRRHR